MELTDSAGQWPSVGIETLEWQPAVVIETGRGLGPRPERYNASVPSTIASGSPQIPGHVAALAEDASFELTRFDAELGGEVTAFSAILLRSEAVASSQIENLSASARAILTAEIGPTNAVNANAIAANTRAMRAAIDLAKELHPDSIRAMHRILMEHAPRHTPGEWRTEPVWIGTSATSPAGAEYVAPQHNRVPALMDDLMKFVARNDLPVLAQSAIAHAQFETIHPFTDGNGRTGRALIQSMLRAKGLTRSITVPVSSGLLADIPAYHAALTSYQGGDTTPIIELAAQSSLRAVTNAKKLVGDIRNTRHGWNQRVTARNDSAVWRVLDIVARQPVVSADTVAESLGIVETSAYRHLSSLVDAGILKRKSEHRIGVLWRSDEILASIDAFADRAGRRGR